MCLVSSMMWLSLQPTHRLRCTSCSLYDNCSRTGFWDTLFSLPTHFPGHALGLSVLKLIHLSLVSSNPEILKCIFCEHLCLLLANSWALDRDCLSPKDGHPWGQTPEPLRLLLYPLLVLKAGFWWPSLDCGSRQSQRIFLTSSLLLEDHQCIVGSCQQA